MADSINLIHEAVAHQARIRPNATAVVDGETRIDYRTLNTAADEFADQMTAQGAGPGRLLPVMLPRSAHLVAILLAILKCGAGYAALDRRWPAERIRSIVRRLQPPFAVVEADAGDVGVQHWTPSEPPSGARRRRESAAPVTADSVAMVFFTSGTTGVPKGVLSPHRATTRLFRRPTFARFGPGEVMPIAAPVPWDAFAMELWGMLTTGGTAVVIPDDVLFPEDLRELVTTVGITSLWLSSSLFNLFLDEDPHCFDGINQVLTGGERLSTPHVRTFLEHHPRTTLVNGYGPVENCVFATAHTVRSHDCDLRTGIPIGIPVPATGIHLLQDGDPVPDGTTGEICISGEGLAIGYLADPAATAARFVTTAIEGIPTRLYRSGDLGQRDADGVLHFLGRADRQIKIFGHRVEPAELENAAVKVPGVRAAHAVPVPGVNGGYEHLALFYIPRADGPTKPPEPDELRKALIGTLPHYLLPGAVQRLDTFPTTPNGKLDHIRLLASLELP